MARGARVSRARVVTDAEKARVLELHGEGKSRGVIARDVGRDPATVTRIVQAAGLSFDRNPGVVAAVKARVVDAAESRTRIEQKLNAFAERRLEWLESHEAELDSRSLRDEVSAIGIAVEKSATLAGVDKGRTDPDEVKGIVDQWDRVMGDG